MSVTPADIAEAMGLPSPTSTQVAQWSRWISSALLILRVGDGVHDGLGDLSLLDTETVDYVVTEAVIAHARRPDNATQVEVAVDDGRVSRTYSSGEGRVTIQPNWWAMLSPTTESRGAFTITPASAGPGYATYPAGSCWPPTYGPY